MRPVSGASMLMALFNFRIDQVLYLFKIGIYIKNSVIIMEDIAMLLIGYNFGASFVAFFIQLCGGIYTKAADVSAYLAGKNREICLEKG